ncbi:translation initiation factor IF-2-like [Oenanthe melanoleuca]|uniref:translation initiation factor IF-2-like n=1 Tax=Oenanthe melanoleuca TaxID=2939378 RepID=UPI0024C1BBA5|nr:translation initiation factor IF-2-like [Oenanthe melanoleuca]
MARGWSGTCSGPGAAPLGWHCQGGGTVTPRPAAAAAAAAAAAPRSAARHRLPPHPGSAPGHARAPRSHPSSQKKKPSAVCPTLGWVLWVGMGTRRDAAGAEPWAGAAAAPRAWHRAPDTNPAVRDPQRLPDPVLRPFLRGRIPPRGFPGAAQPRQPGLECLCFICLIKTKASRAAQPSGAGALRKAIPRGSPAAERDHGGSRAPRCWSCSEPRSPFPNPKGPFFRLASSSLPPRRRQVTASALRGGGARAGPPSLLEGPRLLSGIARRSSSCSPRNRARPA